MLIHYTKLNLIVPNHISFVLSLKVKVFGGQWEGGVVLTLQIPSNCLPASTVQTKLVPWGVNISLEKPTLKNYWISKTFNISEKEDFRIFSSIVRYKQHKPIACLSLLHRANNVYFKALKQGVIGSGWVFN